MNKNIFLLVLSCVGMATSLSAMDHQCDGFDENHDYRIEYETAEEYRTQCFMDGIRWLFDGASNVQGLRNPLNKFREAMGDLGSKFEGNRCINACILRRRKYPIVVKNEQSFEDLENYQGSDW